MNFVENLRREIEEGIRSEASKEQESEAEENKGNNENKHQVILREIIILTSLRVSLSFYMLKDETDPSVI